MQGVEIVEEEGDESEKGQVWCKINIGYSSQGVTVGMGEGVVMLDRGRVVGVTGVGCWRGNKSGA